MPLKIKPEDMAVLRERVTAIVKQYPTAAEEYRARGRSHKRYRWDVLRGTKLKIGDGVGMKGDLDLYAYMDDDHIDSALRAILGSEYPKVEDASG